MSRAMYADEGCGTMRRLEVIGYCGRMRSCGVGGRGRGIGIGKMEGWEQGRRGDGRTGLFMLCRVFSFGRERLSFGVWCSDGRGRRKGARVWERGCEL